MIEDLSKYGVDSADLKITPSPGVTTSFELLYIVK
jgi:hypothetical protein